MFDATGPAVESPTDSTEARTHPAAPEPEAADDMPAGKQPGGKKPRNRGPKPDPASKRSQGQDRHTTPRKAFHAEAELFAALEKYIREADPAPNESAALRTALREFLERRGYWPPKSAD